MTIEELDPTRLDALRAFFAELPEGDLTFIKEDVRDPATVEGWTRPGGRVRRWTAVGDDGRIAGFVSLAPLLGWSSHVGELRLVVGPAHRGHRVGRALARFALMRALELGLRKVVVEVVAEQQAAIALFGNLGFRGEALLSDHIRDHDGRLRDLLVLAHDAEDQWSAMSAVGVADEVA